MNNKRLKKIILVVVLTLSVAATWLYANPGDIATDSGFDASYDSGGGGYSSGGSFDYGGGFDYDSSHDYGGSSHGDRSSPSSPLTKEEKLIIFAIDVIPLVIFCYTLRRSEIKQRKKEILEAEQRVEELETIVNRAKEKVINARFQEYIKEESKEKFILNRYQDYLDIQNAWMNFDYNMLRDKTTNELYNQYQMQLETLKVKGQKNVMKDFEYIGGEILNIEENNNKVIVTLEITARFYDYIIEESTNKVVRGKDKVPIRIHYKMKFVKDINIDKITHCPNCGAELKETSTNICEFCRTQVTKETEKWLLAEKNSLGQF